MNHTPSRDLDTKIGITYTPLQILFLQDIKPILDGND